MRTERRVELERINSDKDFKFISLRVKLGIKDHERVWHETDSRNPNSRYGRERSMTRLVNWDKWSGTHTSVNSFIDKMVGQGFKVTKNYFYKLN